MRIISGKYRSCLIKVPKGAKIRPTQDLVKKALFDILGARISGAVFLELFAGSANIGIEALSRGAKRVFLVENNRICIKTIARNLKMLKILYDFGIKSEQIDRKVVVTVLPIKTERAIEVLSQKKQKFDFVFLDPPYYQDQAKNALKKVGLYDILNARAYIIVEHNKRQILPQEFPQLKLVLRRKYADTALSFYQKTSYKDGPK